MNAPLSNEILKIDEELKRKFEEDPKIAEQLLCYIICGAPSKPDSIVDSIAKTHLYVNEEL